jgi:hypothetical protein
VLAVQFLLMLHLYLRLNFLKSVNKAQTSKL